jgi:hypothetical protein
MVKTLVPSTSEPWNQRTKKVPRPRCWRKCEERISKATQRVVTKAHLGPAKKKQKKTVQNMVPNNIWALEPRNKECSKT